MKNGSGARSAIPLIPIAANRWVAIEKMITPVQKMEQKRAAMKDARKNPFISTSVLGIYRQSWHADAELTTTHPELVGRKPQATIEPSQ